MARTTDCLVYNLSVSNRSTPDGRPAFFVGCIHDTFAGRARYREYPSFHSMLVVGVRVEGASRRFLVQNWLARQQFIEISQEYLKALPFGGPFLHAMAARPHAIRAGFARPARRYEESEHLEAEETERRIGGARKRGP